MRSSFAKSGDSYSQSSRMTTAPMQTATFWNSSEMSVPAVAAAALACGGWREGREDVVWTTAAATAMSVWMYRWLLWAVCPSLRLPTHHYACPADHPTYRRDAALVFLPACPVIIRQATLSGVKWRHSADVHPGRTTAAAAAANGVCHSWLRLLNDPVCCSCWGRGADIILH